MARYAIIESTPGYMPDEEDPPTYDTYDEAEAALEARWRELATERDYLGMPEGGLPKWRMSAIDNGTFAYFDETKEPRYDLGRVVEIITLEETDDLT
jgi:hypothetical protein